MKKYIQYNAAQYASPSPIEVGSRSNPIEIGSRSNPIEVGSRSSSVNSDRSKDDCSGLVLDLSGKNGKMPVSMATNPNWQKEQDSALDLSSTRQNVGGQAEALDLSKPNAFKADSTSKGLFPISTGINQSARSLSQTPPTNNVTKPPIGQYSLLQAALNSTTPNTVVHPALPETASLDPKAKMIAALAAMEASRGIKPFANLGPRPFGLPIPPLSYPNPPVTVIQGIHKPIAITAPQPHVSNVESKSRTSSQTTISVSQSNQIGINEKDKLQYTASSHGTLADKLLLQEGYPRDVERYVLQTQTNSNGIFDNAKMIPVDCGEGFTCFQCKKVYKTKAALKLHATVHKTADERQYECQMCKRRFLHRHHLVVHQRKHSGEKPFRCDACGKTFMAIFLLHKHLRKHVRESGPNCLIASEQLTQLNVKKDTMDFSEFEKVPGSRINEISNKLLPSHGPLVSLGDNRANNMLSDAEKIAELHRMNLALLSKQRDIAGITPTAPIEIIDLSSDELNSSHGSGKDQNFFCKDSNHSEIADIEKTKEMSQESYVQEKLENLPKEDFDISSQAEHLESGKCVDHDMTILHSNKQNHDMSKQANEVQTEQYDKPNPFPAYTSDDEVELDFETGELKVMSQKPDIAEKTNENPENKQSEILKETLEDQSSETDVQSINAKEIDNTIEMSNNNSDDIKDDTVHSSNDNKINGASIIEIDQSNEDKSACVEQISTNVEEDLCHEQIPEMNMKEETTNETVLETGQVKSERNVFEDVGNDMVYKDLNMNEQNICEIVTEIPIADAVESNTKPNDEEHTQVVNLNKLQGDAASISDKQLINNLSMCNNSRKRKNKRSRRSRRVKCEICSRTFHSNHHLILHMAVHKKNQMLQSLKKAKAQQMKSMGYQQQKTNVMCQICKKGFKFQKSLNSHMRVHSEKMAKQKELSKAFRDFMLEAVPSSRTTERTLSSPSGISSESHLVSKNKELSEKFVKSKLDADTNNINESHVSDSVEYFDSYSNDDRQYDPPIKVIIGKDNVKRYLCHACDNTYTTKQKLRMHALIHKDNCFLCDICGKSFFRLLTLEKHIATHKLPRPHICCDCRKSFIHRSSLMRHRVIHEKPNQPSVKQQVEDINFELKMLDTYSMLRKERLQQLQHNAKLTVDPANSVQNIPVKTKTKDKDDILDLSVRVKMEDVSLPPVLSPANTPNNVQPNPLHLSPPVITGESCQSSPNGKGEPAKLDVKREPAQLGVKQEPMQIVNSENNEVNCDMMQVEDKLDCQKRRYSDEMFGPNEGTSDTFHKKSRKTRVYQTSCRFCKEKFPNVMMLKSHMSVHNTVETHLYECSICNHRFTQSCSLLRHLKTSCQENRLKCAPCGKSFHHKHSYNQHMKLHNGIPPNLDGSFYDRRKDEVEGFQVKEERESDIENNNSKSLILAQNAMTLDPLSFVVNHAVKLEQTSIQSAINETKDIKSENVLFDQSVIQGPSQSVNTNSEPGPSHSANTNYDSDDCDAKTLIYSEGKGRLNDLNDFSDNEDVQTISENKKSGVRPPSVDSVSSSGAMTLNLLSAVCSDIRNAEKEEESRRKEQEERQKELETIEILANLKRGRLQSNSTAQSTTNDNSNNIQGDRSVLSLFNSDNTNISNSSNKTVNIPPTTQSANFDSYKPTLPYRSPELMSPPLHKGEPRNILNVPQIPTVVFEIAAEAEKLRQERLSRLAHPDIRNSNQTLASKDSVNSPAFSPQAQFLQNLSQMTLHERLSLLMKAQIPSSSMSPSQSIHSPSPQPFLNKSSPLLPSHTLNRPQSVPSLTSPPTQTKSIKIPPQVMPQDLSIKKLTTSLPSFPTSPPFSPLPGNKEHKTPEAGSKFLSLVPSSFHCELCGKLICNHVEYQHHLQEHLHAIQMKGHSLLAHHGHLGNQGQRSWVLDRAQTLGTASTQNLPREQANRIIKDTETNIPPSTLDLSIKKSLSTASSVQDISSPMTSSDFSNDTIPSPSTPSSSAAAMNLDLLRKELRNKIYARRRSQGLEELTVEFKSPEPAEMTDEERAKLDYRRECNRQAAQRSRMRKKDLVDSLIEELQQEEIVNSDLRQNLESLMAEKKFLLNTLDSHMCVKDKAKISADAATNSTKLDSKEDDQS